VAQMAIGMSACHKGSNPTSGPGGAEFDSRSKVIQDWQVSQGPQDIDRSLCPGVLCTL